MQKQSKTKNSYTSSHGQTVVQTFIFVCWAWCHVLWNIPLLSLHNKMHFICWNVWLQSIPETEKILQSCFMEKSGENKLLLISNILLMIPHCDKSRLKEYCLGCSEAQWPTPSWKFKFQQVDIKQNQLFDTFCTLKCFAYSDYSFWWC